MVLKLVEQLHTREKWLDCPEVNYTSKDFLEDWKDYAKAVEKNHSLELISDNTYSKCKEVLMDYICLFQQAGTTAEREDSMYINLSEETVSAAINALRASKTRLELYLRTKQDITENAKAVVENQIRECTEALQVFEELAEREGIV